MVHIRLWTPTGLSSFWLLVSHQWRPILGVQLNVDRNPHQCFMVGILTSVDWAAARDVRFCHRVPWIKIFLKVWH